ncbi:hypothetical protein OSB04_031858 [Centaurea solstitialis]|uniref:Uncharacterized protein n=1 Tax=Centaurea solstitialis TaxID=347529 RepID=A0AA38SMY2_9ASTR|nr:hypothetical protein OSB04_031858 [Centaurea solstitialis]
MLEYMLNIDWTPDKRVNARKFTKSVSSGYNPDDEVAAMKNNQIGCDVCMRPHLTKDCPNKPMMTPEDVNFMNQRYLGGWNSRNFNQRLNPSGFYQSTPRMADHEFKPRGSLEEALDKFMASKNKVNEENLERQRLEPDIYDRVYVSFDEKNDEYLSDENPYDLPEGFTIRFVNLDLDDEEGLGWSEQDKVKEDPKQEGYADIILHPALDKVKKLKKKKNKEDLSKCTYVLPIKEDPRSYNIPIIISIFFSVALADSETKDHRTCLSHPDGTHTFIHFGDGDNSSRRWRDEIQTSINDLATKQIVVPRYVDWSTLASLGVKDQFRAYFKKKVIGEERQQRLRKEKKEAQYSNFLEFIKQVKINMPLVDLIVGMPNYVKFIKEMISNRSKFGGEGVTLGLGELRSTQMTIQLADRSIKYPVGLAEDILVQVDKSPFLNIVVEVIHVARKQLSLGIDKERVTFSIDNAKSYAISTDDIDYMDDFDPIIEAEINDYLSSAGTPKKIFMMRKLEDDFKEIEELLLKGVLAKCEESHLVLNWEKCHFMVREGIVLGHKISKSGLEVDKVKIDTISKLPPPTNIKRFRSFLGHIGFYRRFIKDFSKLTWPLSKLLEKDDAFIFNEDCVKAFDLLKRQLTNAPIMVPPDWNQPFEIMCDASEYVVGVVLEQRINDHFQPISYVSQTLNDAQENYTTTENELFGVVFAIEKFRSYLIKDSKFEIKIRDKKGAKNLAADHLSRHENPNMQSCGEEVIRDKFPDEDLKEIRTIGKETTPWFADFANYLAASILVKGMTHQQKLTADLLEAFEEPEREFRKRNRKKSKANKVRPRALIFEMGDEAPMWTSRRAAPTGPTNPITKLDLNKEIPGKLLHMIKDLTFDGKNDSNPIVHMENFVDICDLFKTEEGRDDVIRLRVFPVTLTGEARAWLRSLEPRSITTWEGLRSKFLSRFFPPSKIDKLRAEIRSFQQDDGETISEAWERFKHLLNSCPSHGLNKSEQVQTFYSGLAYSSRATLDSSAGGIFMYKTPTEGYKLLEDMLIHNIDWRTDKRLQIPRMAEKISTDFDPSDELAAMKNQQVKFERKIEELIKSVHALQVGCEECSGPHLTKDCPNRPMMTPEEVNYLNRGDYQGRWNNNRNFIPRPPGFFTPNQQNQIPDVEPRVSIEDRILQFMDTQKKLNEEVGSYLRNHQSTIQNLELEVGRVS